MLRNTFGLILLIQSSLALRFAHFPITVNTELLIVGRPSHLSCNYVKFRTETVREITWFAGYEDGMRMKIFHYNLGTNEKEGSDYEFVKTEGDTATDSGLTITLPEFREPRMTMGCEVQVLRDSGYGSVRHSKKMAEANFTVANTRNHRLALKPGSPTASLRHQAANRLATVGKPLIVTCTSRGSVPPPNLTLSINGKDVEGMYGGRLDFLPYDEDRQEQVVTGYLDAVSHEEFEDDDVLIAECVAKFQDFLLEKKQLALKKQIDVVKMKELRRGPREWVDLRQQRRQDQGHNLLEEKLLDLIDPARHVHPGIPYDFYSGYVVLVAERLTTQRPAYSHVLGKLPRKVQRALEQQFGQYEQVDQHNVRMKMPPVDVLNLLGELGYRVIGTSSPERKEMVWTLEHRNFDGIVGKNEI